jgi:hypothetical protein
MYVSLSIKIFTSKKERFQWCSYVQPIARSEGKKSNWSVCRSHRSCFNSDLLRDGHIFDFQFPRLFDGLSHPLLISLFRLSIGLTSKVTKKSRPKAHGRETPSRSTSGAGRIPSTGNSIPALRDAAPEVIANEYLNLLYRIE